MLNADRIEIFTRATLC